MSEERFKIEFQPSGEVRVCVRAEDFDAQRLRADTAEAELKAMGERYQKDLMLSRERFCYGNRADAKLAAAEQRIADRDALLRSTSARLWNAHLALNRLIELEPAHAVKLLTDTIHTLAYAHKCIDMPHWDALNPECCKVSAEDQALLDAGEYTPEELFGIGGKPSCPKCFNPNPEAESHG